MVPYAEAGPLYGLVWPILISVAVTPGPCWARTGAPATATPSASSSAIVRRLFMVVLLGLGRCGERRDDLTNMNGHRAGAVPARARSTRTHPLRSAPAMPNGITYMNRMSTTP